MLMFVKIIDVKYREKYNQFYISTTIPLKSHNLYPKVIVICLSPEDFGNLDYVSLLVRRVVKDSNVDFRVELLQVDPIPVDVYRARKDVVWVRVYRFNAWGRTCYSWDVINQEPNIDKICISTKVVIDQVIDLANRLRTPIAGFQKHATHLQFMPRITISVA